MNLTKNNTHLKIRPRVLPDKVTVYDVSILIHDKDVPFFGLYSRELSYAQQMCVIGTLIEGLFDSQTKEFWNDRVNKEIARIPN